MIELHKNNIKTAFLVLTSIFALNESHINAKCSSLECNKLNKFLLDADNKNIKISNVKVLKNLNISLKDQFQINKTLEEEIYELDKFMDSILVSNIEADNVPSENFAYQIKKRKICTSFKSSFKFRTNSNEK